MGDLAWLGALGGLLGVSAAANAALGGKLLSLRSARKQSGVFAPWPIPLGEVGELDPDLAPQGDMGVGLAGEVSFMAPVGSAASPSELELWVLCALAKKARLIFEFGTCTGRTAYLLARNSPPDARVVTLTLPPQARATYQGGSGDATREARAAIDESRFDTFFYSGKPDAGKIRQLLGDSKAFDESEYAGRCDLIFVDGSHARSYVESDSEKALRMLAPGGVILWHDYRGPKRIPGVYQALNTLARRLPLRLLRGTSLVCYRAPA